MIFMSVTKSVKPPFLDRDDGIRQQPPSQFKKQTNCLFYINLLSENQKEAFLTPYLERTAEAMGVIRTTIIHCSVVSDVRSLKEVDCHPRRGRRGSHIIITLSPSTRQQSDITRFYTVRKHLPTLNTLNSALVGDMPFSGSVETLKKRFGMLVYCWKYAYDGRKVIVKKKTKSTANRVLCMPERIRGQVSLFCLS